MFRPRMSLLMVVLAALACATALAGPDSSTAPKRSGAAGFAEYDRIRKALAGDSLEGVPGAAASLASSLKSVEGPGKSEAAETAKAAQQLSKETSIEEARTSFKGLSAAYIRLLRKSDATGELFRFHCPMAKADWVQSDRETANPYYGASMPGCGSVVPWTKD